jgi:hypothetical protein
MKKFALVAFCTLGLAASTTAAELSDADKQFLTNYEKVHAALAADKLADAKAAAGEMGDDGAAIAKSESIITARKEFGTLSEKAVNLAKGQSGYYVAYCPMAKKSWVQTSEKISNPYEGKEMLSCGVIKK